MLGTSVYRNRILNALWRSRTLSLTSYSGRIGADQYAQIDRVQKQRSRQKQNYLSKKETQQMLGFVRNLDSIKGASDLWRIHNT